MPQEYKLKRDGDLPLVFEGELLGYGTSQRDMVQEQPRWFEVRIFLTAGGTYVVGGVGRSTVRGETDRYWAETCDSGQAVVRTLTRVDEDDIEYITNTARDALSAAAEVDTGIHDAFLKRVA